MAVASVVATEAAMVITTVVLVRVYGGGYGNGYGGGGYGNGYGGGRNYRFAQSHGRFPYQGRGGGRHWGRGFRGNNEQQGGVGQQGGGEMMGAEMGSSLASEIASVQGGAAAGVATAAGQVAAAAGQGAAAAGVSAAAGQMAAAAGQKMAAAGVAGKGAGAAAQKGHYSSMCIAVLCDLCEKADHVSAECELLRLPKLSVRSCGTMADDLFYFELPEEAVVVPKVESNRKGLIQVEGGSMSQERVVAEMQRLILVSNFQWEVTAQGMSDFVVLFPTRGELQRLVRVGVIQVPNSELRFRVDEWTSSSTAAFEFQDTWVHIGNIPHDLFNYRAIWELGTLLGTTLDVDMSFSRRHGVARVHVSVTNISAIPSGTDLRHVGRGYRLTFLVEPSEVEAMNDDDDDGNDVNKDKNDPDNNDDMDDEILNDMKDLDNKKREEERRT
ncbi:hypothetical protein BRADI_2g33475v3, partial [Brachypodium distachyon]